MSQQAKIFATPGGDDPRLEDYPDVMAAGGDWEDVIEEVRRISTERIVLNMGPVHPSTHGVLRLILELDGEQVRETRVDVGFLHTGIEKNMEFRNWTQGTTFVTRMDYVAPFFQEVAYCLGVEKLLGVTEQIPERATLIRVLLMELNRIGSHMIAIGTGGNELGATTMMTIAFRGREEILRIFERITGLRMNHGFVRPGGVPLDMPEGTVEYVRSLMPNVRRDIGELQDLTLANPIFKKRFIGTGYLSMSAMMALGLTGPSLRAGGLETDLRKDDPYCGYENYEFDVPTYDSSDAYNRTLVRFDECYQSFRIIDQVLKRLDETEGAPVMIADKEIAWPSSLSVGPDGQGNSPEHIAKIMGQSMEALIHHFKLVTEGFKVPAGQVYQQVEHPKGILGTHLVSAGGTRPFRAHFRDPSFSNLQSLSMATEGGQLADVVVSLASFDPVAGGVDR
ncbi:MULTISPECIES: NADH-quinone oxidoreductase subunit D [unclassified Schaalia]|jgi:NADH-quinone oxidoreductase subunit D|uniref:NADH-quinone oxidoreductase subunit D n=1 Tax=unclassified Schaalia TaxID=2691889 RepID=UPI0015F75613|nr:MULTISPECIES: NADH-quinone oxidoreductase subunit D [unclassified Schaalia]